MLSATSLFCLALMSSGVFAVSIDSWKTANDDVYDDEPSLSSPPGCCGDYPPMSSTLPKVLHSQVPYPAGVCVDTNGNFVAVLWQKTIKYTYFFDKNGWVVKTITIPADSLVTNSF